MEQGSSSWCWGWSGVGALAVLAVALAAGVLRDSELARPGPVVLWAADRDAGMLYGLDEELILASRVPLTGPLDLARTDSGRMFVLRASGFLDELDARGELLREVQVGPCLDLETLGEVALLVQQAGRALALDAQGEPRLLADQPGSCCIAGSRDSVLLGTQDGRVLRVALDGSGVQAEAALGGSIVDLVSASDAGAYALDAAGQRLLRLAPDLSLRWQAQIGIEARHLCLSGDRVWLVDTQSPRVLRYGPDGKRELDRAILPQLGLDRALSWTDGGVLLAAPGAILQLDAQGHLAPGQGGFNYLAALAR